AAPAGSELASLAADERIREAVGYWRKWDFSTPTGLPVRADDGHGVFAERPATPAEVDASVAASLYAVWRANIVRLTIDDTLKRAGLTTAPPNTNQTLAALRRLLTDFSTRHGVGASGLSFFVVDGATSPEQARDTILLRALRDGLKDLAGPAFAPAFQQS